MDEPVSDAQQLWTACQEFLQTQVTDAVWLSTFQDVTAVEMNGSELVIAVPSAVVTPRPSCPVATQQPRRPGTRRPHRLTS